MIKRGAPGRPVAARGQWVIDVAAHTCTFAQFVGIAEEEREFRFRVAMDRSKEHIAAIIENRLSAIAVVIVDIEDGYFRVALI
ncbi:hypothetical protein D3C76_1259650 [compost metagenome]